MSNDLLSCSTPPALNRVCRSPYVTPNHPLYVFGGGLSTPAAPRRNNNSSSNVIHCGAEASVWRKERTTNNCIKSMVGMSLSSPSETDENSPPDSYSSESPVRKLQRSHAFDDDDYTAEAAAAAASLAILSPRVNNHKYDDSKNSCRNFGTEGILKMSETTPLQRRLYLIDGALDESSESLSRRLRRMKRRLFLESVAAPPNNRTSPPPPPPAAAETVNRQYPEDTPKHSNRSSKRSISSSFLAKTLTLAESSMEGMEIVLEDLDSEEPKQSATVLARAPHKRLSSDSFATDATAVSTAFDDPNWGSLSSIYEGEE